MGVPAGTLTRAARRRVTGMSVACAPARRQRSHGASPASPISCLAALHPEAVVATVLALAPGSTLALIRAQCSQCPAAQRDRVDAVVRESVDLLGRLDGADRKVLLVDAPLDAPDGAPEPGVRPSRLAGRGWSRRELFTAHQPSDGGAPAHAVTGARAELLRCGTDQASITGALTCPVSARGCTFCDACVAVCPTRALSVDTHSAPIGEPDDGVPRLELSVDPSACVGCRRCEQVCVEGLLVLGNASAAPEVPVAGQRVVVAQGWWLTCARCDQPLAPGESAVCRRCESGASLLADVLAR